MNVCPECGLAFDEGEFCTQDGAPLVATSGDPILGTMVGPYRVVHLVGSGGMGRVYKGVNPTIRSRVAIKVLSHECSQRPDLIDRFFAEARAVNFIRHESIVNILDLSRLGDGRPYIIMEYLDGWSLGRVIAQRGRLPVGSFARLIEEVLSALGAAHQKGVVHRDVKPDNIFVSLQGRAKILDFGIAKLAAEDRLGPDPTRAGSLLGTPHYMSPEQAQSRPVDARADLYAIGVLLYEGATGRKPFTGSSVYEILRGHIELPPVPPRQLAPELPAAFEQVVLRALAKEPADRWQTAQELATCLSASCQGVAAAGWDPLTSRPRNESVGPPTPSSTPMSSTSSRRRTAIIISTTTLVTGAVAAAIGLSVAGARDRSPAAVDPSARVETASSASSDAIPTAPSSSPATGDQPESGDRASVASGSAGNTGAPSAPDEGSSGKSARDAVRGAVQALAPAAGATPITANDHRGTPGRHALSDRITERNPTPTAWDVTGYVPKALATARSYFPDAVLVRIDADGVYPSGMANLQLDSKFGVTYRFMSPSAAVRPKDLPLGVEHKPTCMLYVVVEAAEIEVYTLEGWSCADEVKLRLPRCSAREAWARAAAQGAPTRNAVAELSYRIFRGRPMWLFQIGQDHDHEIVDDC